MSRIISIDLGSTMSSVAVMEGDGKPTVIVNEEGGYGTPSVIALKNGERKVGAAAKRQMVVNPKETVNIIKRFMGLTYEESQEAIKHVQYDVVNKDGMPRVSIEGKEYSPEELSSMIVGKMKKIAEDYLGETVDRAIITVPAYFGDKARAATKLAGELAGLKVERVIAEPTAAILAANLDMKKGGKYIIADVGGSTSDFSVADIADDTVEILSTNGDVFLGGSNFDNAIADYLAETFKDETGIDIKNDVQAMARVKEAAEKAKIELSNSSSTDINLPYITMKDNAPVHMNVTLTKARFNELMRPFITKLMDCATKALELAGLKGSDIDGIVLVGGSCRIPIIQENLERTIGAKIIMSANLDLAVAQGAAIEGGILDGTSSSDILLLDVIPLSYGIETFGGVFTKLIEGNTTIPCQKSQIFSTAADNQTSVDICVLQGERPMAKDNKNVGMFRLEGILPAPRGVPQIEVTFDIDSNGILKVSAKDKGTGKEQSITIESNGALSQDEIDKIKADAEKYAEEDKKAKETADTLNKGDSIAFTIEKNIKDLGDKLTDDEKKTLEDLVAKMKKAVADKDADAVNATEREINEAFVPISNRIYSSQSTQDTASGENDAKTNDDVQDADFEEVK